MADSTRSSWIFGCALIVLSGVLPDPARAAPPTITPIQSEEGLEIGGTPTESPVRLDQEKPVVTQKETLRPKNLQEAIHQKDLVKTEFGIHLLFSPAAFGNTAIHPSQQGVDGNGNTIAYPSYAVEAGFEYQPKFLQSIGVLGIGTYLSIYPVIGGNVTASYVSIFGAGGLIRYQFKYWPKQWLVPVVAYNFEALHVEFASAGIANLLIHGPTAGLWIPLDFLEPDAAAQGYVTTGVARMYAVAELTLMKGTGGDLGFNNVNYPIVVDGRSMYFGLRFEF